VKHNCAALLTGGHGMQHNSLASPKQKSRCKADKNIVMVMRNQIKQ
jgi:hypothetical protein